MMTLMRERSPSFGTGGEEKATASVPNSMINLLNNVVGAGLFSMPWCLKEATLFTGMAIFIFMAWLNVRSFMLLADSCNMAGVFSYLDLGKSVWGPQFALFAQIITCFYTAGSLVSYAVLAGDCLVGDGSGILSVALGEDSFLGRGDMKAHAIVIYAAGIFLFLPFSLMRNLDGLKYISYVALCATIFAAFIVVVQVIADPKSAKDDDGDIGDDVQWAGFPLGVWRAVPIVNVAFTAHYNGPRFFMELKERTLGNFHRVAAGALGGALLIYLLVAVCGYLSFGGATLGDVLENFRASYPLAIAARAALLAILLACFPKVQHSLRDGVVRLAYNREGAGKEDDGSNIMTADKLPTAPYVGITAALVFAACTAGAVCSQVEVVLAYKGGIFGSLMVYILPPLIHTALSIDTRRDGVSRVEARLLDFQVPTSEMESPTVQDNHTSWQVVLRVMYSDRRFRSSAFMFTWGVGSGTLAVVITMLSQIGVLD